MDGPKKNQENNESQYITEETVAEVIANGYLFHPATLDVCIDHNIKRAMNIIHQNRLILMGIG